MKEKDAVLIQQASGPHVTLLELTHAYHARYAQRHHMEFWSVADRVQDQRHPFWDKIDLILRALHSPEGFQWIFWVDADALITQPYRDLREALSNNENLGMVLHPNPDHFNAGVIYVRNTFSTQKFFDQVWNSWPVNDSWEDQTAINRLLAREHINGFCVLPDQWNSSFGVNQVQDPVIQAWHGFPSVGSRRRLMIEAMEETLRVEQQKKG